MKASRLRPFKEVSVGVCKPGEWGQVYQPTWSVAQGAVAWSVMRNLLCPVLQASLKVVGPLGL